jgi:serine phosphatase RsbU (regulator of sigma subunit)
MSPQGDIFGEERLLEVVRANLRRSAGEIVDRLCRAALGFSEVETLLDDTTVVVIKVEDDAAVS